MKKLLLFLLIIACTTQSSYTQNTKTDSLLTLLKTDKEDTNKVNHLYQLSEESTDNKDVMRYAQQSLLLAEKLKYKKGMANAANNIGFVFNAEGQTKEALDYLHRALKIQEEINDKQGIAISLNNIGGIYNSQGQIKEALDYYHRSLKIREEINDKLGIANSLNNIAVIYGIQEQKKESFDYFQRALKLYEEINDKQGIAYALNNIAAIFQNQRQSKEALDYYYRALKLQEEINDKLGIASSLNGIGMVFYNQGQLKEALDYNHRSLKLREEINDKLGIPSSLHNIGDIYFKQKRYALAIAYADSALQVAQAMGYPEDMRNAAELLYRVYKDQKQWQPALHMNELYIAMRDSVANAETKKASIRKQMGYEYEKKEALAKAEQDKLDAIAAEEKQKQRIALILVAIVLLLVAVFAVFMYRRFKITQKQKHIIELQKDEVTRQKTIVEEQKQVVEEQKHLVEEHHKEITDSINYAERIQRSFIATKEILNENLNDYFVLFKPKDIVSGDFYWASKLNNGNFALVTADSTGHGVPGAIMSLLNVTSLEKAIETHTQPADILNATRKIIIERLKKDGSAEGGKDGMDASLTVYDFKTNKLFIAAANNPVWIVRGSETIEIKPDKMPVGKHDKQAISFTQQEMELQTGDVVYTLTDGFPDQFGGEKGKKFMSKNLRELVAANAHLPMREQKVLLETAFKNWVGTLEQVDDVTLIGVRV